MEKALCILCGEPMPTGEEMFKFHGYSGPCPKPMKNIESKDEEINLLRAEIGKLQIVRKALVGLVGSDTRAELEAMEVIIRTSNIPEEDRANTINAIHALLSTLSESKVQQ